MCNIILQVYMGRFIERMVCFGQPMVCFGQPTVFHHRYVLQAEKKYYTAICKKSDSKHHGLARLNLRLKIKIYSKWITLTHTIYWAKLFCTLPGLLNMPCNGSML